MTILADAPLLTPAQIGELASSLDGLHGRVLKAIERLQKDIDTHVAGLLNQALAFIGTKGD